LLANRYELKHFSAKNSSNHNATQHKHPYQCQQTMEKAEERWQQKKMLPHDLKERKASIIEKHTTAFS
jgi:hypothetical protein